MCAPITQHAAINDVVNSVMPYLVVAVIELFVYENTPLSS